MEAEAQRVTRWSFAGPVARAYEYARGPVEVIVGPTGGGKSTASARRCLRIATWQHPSPRDGVRKARVCVVTPTYRRAWDQVIPSYRKVMDGFPGQWFGAKGDPLDHIIDTTIPVNGRDCAIHLEVMFRAVGDLDLDEFYRGLEVTAFWYPEMDTHADENILSKGSNRAGRYPEPDDRPADPSLPSAYKGVFGDANAPIMDSWFHRRLYLQRRPGDRLHRQPSGFSPKAENMDNLRKIDRDYYAKMAQQLDAHDVRRLLDNKPGYGRHGQPVHPDFDEELHVSQTSIPVDTAQPLIIGVDCGSNSLHPGATMGQRGYSGQWRVLAEVHLDDPSKEQRALGVTGQMDTKELGLEIRRLVETRGRGAKGAVCVLDPAAASGSALSEFTTAQALQHWSGVECQFAPTNDPVLRRGALKQVLKRTCGPREAAFVVSGPDCPGLVASLTGGWHYPTRGGKTGTVADKGRFSHVGEAAEYMVLGAEGLDGLHGRFIRPDAEGGDAAPRVIYE